MTTLATRSRPRAPQRVPARRPAPAPRPEALTVATVLVGLGFGAVVGQGITVESWSQLRAAGGPEIFIGSITGLAGTYLALVMVLLVSRIPLVERVLGQDGLVRLHKRLAPWPLTLLTAHALILTAGYAAAARTGVLHEIHALVFSFPDVLIATAGMLLFWAIGIVSIGAIRRRIPRERWWALHLCVYLALALSFAHTIALGPSFVGHPLARGAWIALWVATAGSVLSFRIGLPIVRSLRHQLTVAEVHDEAPGVASIVLQGRHLERLAISGGQFFEWRFLARGMWYQAHPFSVSALPRPPYLRLTVKAVGDFSAAVHSLRPGTRVAIEGPYGAFTAHARRRQKVALFAGGIGVTAIRALLEYLPSATAPVVVLRATRGEELALSREVHELVQRRKGQVYVLVGNREEISMHDVVGTVRDLRERDVYVAGPEGFVNRVVELVRNAGVPEDALHFEAYAL